MRSEYEDPDSNYPIAIGFFVVAVAVVIFSLINQKKINDKEKANMSMGME